MTDRHPATLRHLLLTFPELEVEHDGRDVVDDLVKGAILALQGERGNSAILILGEVIERIQHLTGLAYEAAEVQNALERLQSRGFLRFTSPGHDSFVADSQAAQEAAVLLKARARRDEAVLADWLEDLRTTHALTATQLASLSDSFHNFLGSLIHRRAAEAAAFLYLNDDEGQSRFYKAIDSQLPAATSNLEESVARVAERAFGEFFRSTDSERRDYIADRLQVAFYYHLLSIDPRGSELVRESFPEKTLYLDTNVVYRLLGLHGPAYAYGPAAVVDISRRLGCTLKVTRATINEYLLSLRAEVHRIRAQPVTRESYVQVLAQKPIDHWSFMQAFYKQFQSGKIKNVDDFERRYTSVVPLLQEWGIEIDECVLSDSVRDTERFQDQFSQLNNWHNAEKHPESIEHDIFMGEMIRQLRGNVDEAAVGVRYWLLTYDRKLAKYSVFYATAHQLPFCMVADDWLQIARPFLPRTKDYQNAFMTLLGNPVLHPPDGAVPFDHMVDALHRLERYEELPMPVVASIVTSSEFTRKFRSARSADEERRLLEIATAEAAASALEENETLKGKVAQLETQGSGLAQRIGALDAEVQKVTEDRVVSDKKVAALEAVLGEKEEEALKKGQAVESANTTKGLIEQQMRRLKWVVYGLTSSVVLFEVVRGGAGIWPELGWLQRSVLGAATVLVLIGLLVIPLGRRGWKGLLGVMGVLGTLGLLYQMWVLGS